ncbi:MAG: GNAT family N-acetyltransferase [Patescibacteria group bacterium]|nr:GNAT family N-acetyltransferase [Patescibacteria group bacterium]
MKFRKFKKSDIRQIAKIKNSVFSSFNKSEYFEKGTVSKYLNYTNPKKSDKELLEAFKITKDSIFYVAEENDKIFGYIKGRKNRIGNLFVLGQNHKKGIGRKLVDLFEKEAEKQNSKEIKINSSIYAVPFYQKRGYKKTTGIRNLHGLKIQPMKKVLN